MEGASGSNAIFSTSDSPIADVLHGLALLAVSMRNDRISRLPTEKGARLALRG